MLHIVQLPSKFCLWIQCLLIPVFFTKSLESQGRRRDMSDARHLLLKYLGFLSINKKQQNSIKEFRCRSSEIHNFECYVTKSENLMQYHSEKVRYIIKKCVILTKLRNLNRSFIESWKFDAHCNFFVCFHFNEQGIIIGCKYMFKR